MNNLTIKEHSFTEAKQNIKAFSEQVPSTSSLKRVEVKTGLLGWREHKVTGEEMNLLASQVQESIIEIHDLIKSTISEFNEVYNAFETLDKDYIQSIIISLKSAQIANEEAKKAQIDISNTIDALKLTVSKLTQFRSYIIEEIENIKNTPNEQKHYDSVDYSAEIDNIKELIHKQEEAYENLQAEYVSHKRKSKAAIISATIASAVSIGGFVTLLCCFL
jgi:hypothetical protein